MVIQKGGLPGVRFVNQTLLVNERARSQSDLSLSHPVSKHQENRTLQCDVLCSQHELAHWFWTPVFKSHDMLVFYNL